MTTESSCQPEQGETEKTKLEQLTPSEKWRRVANYLIRNPVLRKKIIEGYKSEAHEEDEKTKHLKPLFDPGLYRRKRKPPPGLISVEARFILDAIPQKRTNEDIDLAEEEIAEMAFFKRFSYDIRRELTKCLLFCMFRKGQVILKVGGLAEAMYVIISGTVAVLIPDIDTKTGEKCTIEAALLSNGDCFGHLSLLRDIRRPVSVCCKGTVQLLRLEKVDFERLIRPQMWRQDNFGTLALNEIPAIVNFPWKESGIHKDTFKFHTRILRFVKDTVIIGGVTEVPNAVHFIVAGECRYEQDIDFIVEYGLGYKRLRPAPSILKEDDKRDVNGDEKATIDQDASGDQKDKCAPPKIYTKRLEVCTLRRGNYFGVGEDLSKSYVTAIDTVECILLPRYLLAKGGPRYMEKLKNQLEECYPSVQELLDRYLELISWNRYRKSIVEEVMKRCPPKCSFGRKIGGKPNFNKYF